MRPTLKVDDVHVWAASLGQPLESASDHVAYCGDLATPQIDAVASMPHGTRSRIHPSGKRPRQTLALQALRSALPYEVDQGRLVFALHDAARKWRRAYRTPDIPSAK